MRLHDKAPSFIDSQLPVAGCCSGGKSEVLGEQLVKARDC